MSTTARREKLKGCTSSASDNKQNVRRIQNCWESSVQTVLSLGVFWMSGALVRRRLQPAL